MITEREICMDLMTLIEKLELRIDRTNKMVAMLADERRRNDALWQHLFTKHSPAANNINVNQ